MAACQALEFRKEEHKKLGKGTQIAYDTFRKYVDFIENDKDIEIYDELEKATEIVKDGTLLKAVESAVKIDIQ